MAAVQNGLSLEQYMDLLALLAPHGSSQAQELGPMQQQCLKTKDLREVGWG